MFGAITATFQNDIKKLVAYSTISQIGYLVCGCGFCCSRRCAFRVAACGMVVLEFVPYLVNGLFVVTKTNGTLRLIFNGTKSNFPGNLQKITPFEFISLFILLASVG